MIKRTKDEIEARQGPFKVRLSQSCDEDIYVAKEDLLKSLGKLGKDEVQDGKFYFIPSPKAVVFFSFLHQKVTHIITEENVLEDRQDAVLVCLQKLSTSDELRSELLLLLSNSLIIQHYLFYSIEGLSSKCQ